MTRLFCLAVELYIIKKCYVVPIGSITEVLHRIFHYACKSVPSRVIIYHVGVILCSVRGRSWSTWPENRARTARRAMAADGDRIGQEKMQGNLMKNPVVVAPQALSVGSGTGAAQCGQRVNECGQVGDNSPQASCPQLVHTVACDIHALSTRSPLARRRGKAHGRLAAEVAATGLADPGFADRQRQQAVARELAPCS